MGRRALIALAAVGLASRACPALASPLPDTLSFEFSACPIRGLDANAFTQAVRAELEADGVGRVMNASASESDGLLAVRVECDSALTARASLKATHTGRERREQIALGDAAPSARARALALALAELVRASWPVLSAAARTRAAATGDAGAGAHSKAPQASEPKPATKGAASPVTAPAEAAPKAAAPKAAAPAEAAPKAAARPRTASKAGASPAPALKAAAPTLNIEEGRAGPPAGPRTAFTLAAALRLRWFVSYQSVLLGGDLGTDYRALRFRAEALVTSTSDALGSASLGSAALSVGYRLFDWRLGALNLAVYPMASLGLTWLRGSSVQPSTRVEPATGFYGDARVTLETSVPQWTFGPTLSAEIGRASGFVARAGERTLGATGGFFFGASAGVRY